MSNFRRPGRYHDPSWTPGYDKPAKDETSPHDHPTHALVVFYEGFDATEWAEEDPRWRGLRLFYEPGDMEVLPLGLVSALEKADVVERFPNPKEER
jgi:hypothetical protein